MSRSPLAYPLNRGADTDAGGAADLQTDIMRFMAILSMCLLAIFALVQSIPLAPIEPDPVEEPQPLDELKTVEEPQPVGGPETVGGPSGPIAAEAAPTAPEPERAIILTRPKWESTLTPVDRQPIAAEAAPTAPERAVPAEAAPTAPEPATPAAVAPEVPEREGFTLRFASDTALLRAVAAQHVGLYAIENSRARRMAVSDSRISFWDASTPNAFHEMESGTVPGAVVQALARSGADTTAISWGVTLPGRMTAQLDELMQAHRGGLLIISADGDIHWEAS